MKEHPILITKPLGEQGESLGILFISGVGSNPPQYLAVDNVTVNDWGGATIVSGFNNNHSLIVKFPNTTPWLFVQRALIDPVPREEFQRDMLIQEHTQLCRRMAQNKELEATMPLPEPILSETDVGRGQYL